MTTVFDISDNSWVTCLLFLGYKDLLSVGSTCKHLYDLIKSDKNVYDQLNKHWQNECISLLSQINDLNKSKHENFDSMVRMERLFGGGNENTFWFNPFHCQVILEKILKIEKLEQHKWHSIFLDLSKILFCCSFEKEFQKQFREYNGAFKSQDESKKDDDYNYTLLLVCRCSSHDCPSILKILLSKVDIKGIKDETNKEDCNLLLISMVLICQHISVGCVSYLLDTFGSDQLKLMDDLLSMGLHCCLHDKKHVKRCKKFAQLLIKQDNLNIDKKISYKCHEEGEYEGYLLHMVTKLQDIELMRYLMDKGGNKFLFETDNKGNTPIMIACDFDFLDGIKLILEYGGKKILQSSNKYHGIIYYASMKDKADILEYILKVLIELKLIDLNEMEHCNIADMKDTLGNKTAVCKAVDEGYGNVLQCLLLKYNCNVNQCVGKTVMIFKFCFANSQLYYFCFFLFYCF